MPGGVLLFINPNLQKNTQSNKAPNKNSPKPKYTPPVNKETSKQHPPLPALPPPLNQPTEQKHFYTLPWAGQGGGKRLCYKRGPRGHRRGLCPCYTRLRGEEGRDFRHGI